MKIYSNDPQEYTLEDVYSEEFDSTELKDLVEDMIEYFSNDKRALDLFGTWWVGQKIEEHLNDI